MLGASRQTFWICLCCLVVAVALNFGQLRMADDADVWISTLTSLVDFTPYEWGSNRFGTLAPILAMPVRDPVVNHFVQNGITVAAMLGTAFLLGALQARVSTSAWACATLWGLLLVGGLGQFQWLTSYSHPYALSIFLGLLGWRWGLSVARWGPAALGSSLCFLTSLWVNISLGPWLATSIVACQPRSRRSWLLSVLAGLSFVINLLLAGRHRFKVTFQFGVSRDPLGTALALVDNFLHAVRWEGLAIWMLASLLALVYLRRQDFVQDYVRLALGLSLSCTVHWGILSWSAWIEANTANPRYLTPVLWSIILVTALPLARLMGNRGGYWLGLALYSLFRFGAAWPESWVTHWTARQAVALDTLEREKVTVLVGNYWSTWERTYFAYLRAYRAGKPPWLWACTQRSENTRSKWQPQLLAGQRIAFDLKDEARAFAWLGVVYVPLMHKTFVPEVADENFIIGRYTDESPTQPYRDFSPLSLEKIWNLQEPAVWRYLGQGWDGPDPLLGGRFVGAHQADIRFASPAGRNLVLELELTSLAGTQICAAFLNGEGLTQGTIAADSKETLRLNLPARLVRSQNVVSLTFPEARLLPEGHQMRSVEVFRLRLLAGSP